jgi:hypothetical protein
MAVEYQYLAEFGELFDSFYSDRNVIAHPLTREFIRAKRLDAVSLKEKVEDLTSFQDESAELRALHAAIDALDSFKFFRR